MNFERYSRLIRCTVLQSVDYVEVIFHVQVTYNKRCPAGTRIDLYVVATNRNCPEQTIVQTRVKVVYLITEVGGRPPHVEVDSNEGKRALVVSPVPPDVFTIHKPHVRVKDQRRVRGRSNTAARPIAENFGRAENAIKVPNGGKLWCGAGQVYMENISVAEKVESPRNWLW
jgi:hypothetical protein